MEGINFSSKYAGIAELFEGKHPEVDTVILTGGRSSAKSYALGCLSPIALVEYSYNILYSRFTNTSMGDSVFSEVESKIPLLGYEDDVSVKYNEISCGKNKISFKGMKTGSKNQSANLKSLEGYNTWIVDEAEEIPDYDTWHKAYLSIRSAKKRNLSFLLLNPSSVHHWIYTVFFSGKGVEGGFNGIKGNVMYIHTSYLDVPEEYLAKNIIREYEEMKLKDLPKYNQIVLGGWLDAVEGRVYNHFTKNTLAEYNAIDIYEFYAIDWGLNHGFGIVSLKYDAESRTLYCRELNHLSERQLLRNMSDYELKVVRTWDGGVIPYLLNKLGIDKSKYIVCDSAKPTNIEILQQHGYSGAFGIDKPAGSVLEGISALQNCNVVYTECSIGIDFEFRNYSYDYDRIGFDQEKIQKRYDDLLDPIRYGLRFAQRE